MKNITPRRSTPGAFARVLFFLLGFFYAAWELRVLWRELASALRRLRSRS